MEPTRINQRPERPKVVLLRGHQANSWHLRPWNRLADRFDVVLLQTRSNWFDVDLAGTRAQPVRTLRDAFPAGRLGDMAVRFPGDRYLGLGSHLADADIVHSQDLGFWYSMQAARRKERLGFKLVLTVWETIPFLNSYRNVRTRPYRRTSLRGTDLFLATTERARTCLLLEGAAPERIEVCPPGVDDELFAPPPAAPSADQHLIVSPGRLVWEKGHQDVLRATALLHRDIVRGPDGRSLRPRVLIVGAGPEERRLRAYAGELGIASAVELRAEVPYREMPDVYHRASALVLASLPIWSWEEQFGMVLVEAMCARLPVVASTSGAIPEVMGDQVGYFSPGDYVGLAHRLAEGPLSRPPGRRTQYDADLVGSYSSAAFAARLGDAYERVLER